MAIATPCQTPGAVYHTIVNRFGISVGVTCPSTDPQSSSLMPFLRISDREAKILETNIHNALELVLAPYFKRSD